MTADERTPDREGSQTGSEARSAKTPGRVPVSTEKPEDSAIARPVERRVQAPPIDIFDTEDGLVLYADLPGVTADHLELQIQDNKLLLFARVTHELPDDARPIHQEYIVADYLRSFILSDEVDHERISARLNHGVLEVKLPRAPRPEARRIEIESA